MTLIPQVNEIVNVIQKKGAVKLFPSEYLRDDNNNLNDASECISMMMGDNGNFRTVSTLDAVDILKIAGLDHEDDILLDIVEKNIIPNCVWESPKEYAHIDLVSTFCFFTEGNPYPGRA